MDGLNDLDCRTIRANMDKVFYLVVGGRNDENLLNLIPVAENVIVSTQICYYCKGYGSFPNVNRKFAVCRQCRFMEVERAAKMDIEVLHDDRYLLSYVELLITNYLVTVPTRNKKKITTKP